VTLRGTDMSYMRRTPVFIPKFATWDLQIRREAGSDFFIYLCRAHSFDGIEYHFPILKEHSKQKRPYSFEQGRFPI